MLNFTFPTLTIEGLFWLMVPCFFLVLYLVEKIRTKHHSISMPKKIETKIMEGSNDPAYYYKGGSSCKFNNQYEKAVKYFEKAIGLDPNNAFYYYNLGLLHDENWQNEKAMKCYNRAIEIDPNNGYLYCLRGHSHNFMERYEEAQRDTKKALELNTK